MSAKQNGERAIPTRRTIEELLCTYAANTEHLSSDGPADEEEEGEREYRPVLPKGTLHFAKLAGSDGVNDSG